jgi:NADPH2:quinone reductase
VTVIGTASRAQSKQWVKNIGADHVIDHHEPFAKQLKSLGIDSVSYVISLNQTDKHYEQIVEVIAPQGKFALIDDPSETLDIKKLKSKSISLHWEFMFTRSMFHTDDLSKQGELLTKISGLIDQGIIKTTFGENLGNINAKNLKLAHQKIEDNNVIGKIILEGF